MIGVRDIYSRFTHRTIHSRTTWYALLIVLSLALGLGLNAGTIPESPGRWQPDGAKAAILESNWAYDYLTVQPRDGDHISSNLYVALAEGENAWAAAYLERQRDALARASGRATPASAVQVQSVVHLLECYELLLKTAPLPAIPRCDF